LYSHQWSDPDLPIFYQYSFYSYSSQLKLTLLSFSELSFTTAKLPAGNELDNFLINCTVDIFDSFGASTEETVDIHVYQEYESSTVHLVNLLLFNSTTASSIAVSSSVLNRVNCSSSPNCTNLNRYNCLKIEQTCGPCMNDFIGVFGDSNSPCMIDLPKLEIFHCDNEVDCNNNWYYCNKSNHTCELKHQECSNNCSQNGVCMFSNVNSGAFVSECKVNNPTCKSNCHCRGGFSGKMCEISPQILQIKQTLRSYMVSILSNISRTEDINTETLISWSNLLSSITQNPFELSNLAVGFSFNIAEYFIAMASSQDEFDSNKLIGVLQTADFLSSISFFNYRSYSCASTAPCSESNYTANKLVDIVSSFADLILKTAVVGQQNVKYIYSNFRMLTQLSILPVKETSSNDTRAIIGIPSTSLERSVGLLKSDVLLKVQQSSFSSLFSAAIIETHANQYNSYGKFTIRIQFT
jgi:hypothetical protein